MTTAPKHIPAQVPSHLPIHFDCCKVGCTSATVVTNLDTGLKLFKLFENTLNFTGSRFGFFAAI